MSELSIHNLSQTTSNEKTPNPTSDKLESQVQSNWLVYLNASNSKIVLLDFLHNLPNVEVLILRNNSIESLDNIWQCTNLFHLDVSNNKVKSIEGLSRFAVLGQFSATNNKISWVEIERIRHVQIVDTRLSGNDELEKDYAHFRLHLIDSLPNVWSIDGRIVTALERSRVKDFFQSSELSSKPVRHKLSGLIFKQSNSRHGEVISKRALCFLRRFSTTVSHTSQLDEQRLIFAIEQFCEDLCSLNTPTWSCLPMLPGPLGENPKIFVEIFQGIKNTVELSVDLLSALMTSLFFEIPKDFSAFLTEKVESLRDSCTLDKLLKLPILMKMQLSSFLLTRIELDYADRDSTKAVLDAIHDSSFLKICNHILLTLLKYSPSDPKLVIEQENLEISEKIFPPLRSCVTLFAARTLFKFLKMIFSSAQRVQSQNNEFADVIVQGASLLSSESVTPLVRSVKDCPEFQTVGVLTNEFQQPWNCRDNLTVQYTSHEPSTPREPTTVSTLTKELQSLYNDLIDQLPFFYDSADRTISDMTQKLGNAGTRGTPIGASHAYLPRPPPTALRSRDALKAGRHVPSSGPPPLKPKVPARKPKIGDVVLVAVQHTGRIIAVPDNYTVCVQLDIIPDKVGLHPPGSNPFRRTKIDSPSIKIPATLSSEYTFMYFNSADLQWDTFNGIWRSTIVNSGSDRLQLHKPVHTPGSCKKGTIPPSKFCGHNSINDVHEVSQISNVPSTLSGDFETPSNLTPAAVQQTGSVSASSLLRPGTSLSIMNTRITKSRSSSAELVTSLYDNRVSRSNVASILSGRVSRIRSADPTNLRFCSRYV